ncbi:oxidoreductase [Paenibacillus tianjinensis]|uniref:SDR family NAD(P)-dependent oxidoreductase n=1 Tax=Paenibacillus tianjinensis TaxID=2810347 RepID=A0ABX7LB56_9BACL|nr:oxidoreductase [Paenibacillus tianjinensis]QSF45390.1 SDR family NAD(P)-dependent oxidoreductase [Paenibacillus tianjinensis]
MENPRWSEEQIKDLNHAVVIITGGNSGLGLEQAKVLARKGATVILAVRDMDRGHAAALAIQNAYPSATVEAMKLDLTDLESVRSFCSMFQENYNRLDILINNAGVMMPPHSLTKDGFELQFGVNHLGHFALTGLLLPVIMRTEYARVVTVSSLANSWKGTNIYFQDLQWSTNYDRQRAYSQSKLANILFAYELDRRWKAEGLHNLSLCAHPGWSVTNLQHHMNGIMKRIAHFLSQPAEMGALPILRAATDPNVKGGEYFGPSGKNQRKGYPIQVESGNLTHDRMLAERLWKISEELTRVTYPI